jgi:hypothetical protein
VRAVTDPSAASAADTFCYNSGAAGMGGARHLEYNFPSKCLTGQRDPFPPSSI